VDNSRPRRSVDGIVARTSPPRPIRARPHQPTAPRPHAVARPPTASQAHSTPRPEPKKPSKPAVPFWKKVVNFVGQVALFFVLLAIGLLIQSPIIGQLFIILYGIGVFIWHISSRTTFILVLGCFGVVLFASIKANFPLATTFAMYAFLLLIIGTISLAGEVRNEI
jgi:hypothetical protein